MSMAELLYNVNNHAGWYKTSRAAPRNKKFSSFLRAAERAVTELLVHSVYINYMLLKKLSHWKHLHQLSTKTKSIFCRVTHLIKQLRLKRGGELSFSSNNIAIILYIYITSRRPHRQHSWSATTTCSRKTCISQSRLSAFNRYKYKWKQ